MQIVRTETEIARVETWALEGIEEAVLRCCADEGNTEMSYEQGIVDALAWLRGDSDTAPDED